MAPKAVGGTPSLQTRQDTTAYKAAPSAPGGPVWPPMNFEDPLCAWKFKVGHNVVLHSLKLRPTLNGMRGRVIKQNGDLLTAHIMLMGGTVYII